jgi:hypothetical protein
MSCRYGIVPIENSYSGSIPHVYDCLLHFGLFIVAETSTVSCLDFFLFPSFPPHSSNPEPLIFHLLRSMTTACAFFLAATFAASGR